MADEVGKLVMLDVLVPGTRVWNEAKAKSDPDMWHSACISSATSRRCS
jgi:hypothetical protein